MWLNRSICATAVVVAVVCCVVGAGAVGAATVAIHDLGTLGGTRSQGVGINAGGAVVGSATTSGGGVNDWHAFRYDGTPAVGGVMHDLGTLPGGTISNGYGVNAAGQVVGSAATVGEQFFHPFRYDGTPGSGGVMRDLGTLGGPGGEGLGINALGQITGFSETAGDGPIHAFRYDGTPGVDGVMRDLGTLGGGSESAGLGINGLGQVVGYSKPANSDALRAFRHDGTPAVDGVMHDLGTLGGTSAIAYAINASGQVTGTAALAEDVTSRAFRFDGTPGVDGIMLELDAFVGGGEATGFAINDRGFIVGQARRDDGVPVASFWRPDLSIVDLDAWLDAVDPTAGAAWTLDTAFGVNDAGQITGIGRFDHGQGSVERAYRLDAADLVYEPVLIPLPAPVLAGAAGLLIAARAARAARAGRAGRAAHDRGVRRRSR